MAPADSNEDGTPIEGDATGTPERTNTPEGDAAQQTIRQRVFFSDAAARMFLEETEARANARNGALTVKLDEVITILHDIVRLQSRFVLPPQHVRIQPVAPGIQPAPRNNNGHGKNGFFGPPRGPSRSPPPPDPNEEPTPGLEPNSTSGLTITPTPTPAPTAMLVPPVPMESKHQAY